MNKNYPPGATPKVRGWKNSIAQKSIKSTENDPKTSPLKRFRRSTKITPCRHPKSWGWKKFDVKKIHQIDWEWSKNTSTKKFWLSTKIISSTTPKVGVFATRKTCVNQCELNKKRIVEMYIINFNSFVVIVVNTSSYVNISQIITIRNYIFHKYFQLYFIFFNVPNLWSEQASVAKCVKKCVMHKGCLCNSCSGLQWYARRQCRIPRLGRQIRNKRDFGFFSSHGDFGFFSSHVNVSAALPWIL